jgi:hypothetical protein
LAEALDLGGRNESATASGIIDGIIFLAEFCLEK